MEKSILHFIEHVNRVLYLESMEEYEREELVSTLTMVVIEGDRLYGVNVGDSRIYLQRNGQFAQLSDDHAMDEEGDGKCTYCSDGVGRNSSAALF